MHYHEKIVDISERLRSAAVAGEPHGNLTLTSSELADAATLLRQYSVFLRSIEYLYGSIAHPDNTPWPT